MIYPPCGTFKCIWYRACLTIAHALLREQSFQGLGPLLKYCCVPCGTWCMLYLQMTM